jgi:carboxymethylenebutenolidase
MTVRWETAQVDGKPMRIYLGVPDRPGPHAAIVIAQHAGGVDAQIQDMVHRLFREGYIVAAPELFHRQPADMDSSKRTSALLDKEIISDLNATVAHVKKLPEKVGPIGVMGFCMGGRVTYLAASAVKEFEAAAMFYGGNTMKALGDGPSPFERSADIHCPLIAFHGVEDTNPSPDDMKKIDAELTRLGKVHEIHMYLGAGHAFQDFTRADKYRERVARASWAEALAFFKHHLKRAS